MTAREFDRWRAYAAVEPFGEERADLRTATAAAAIVNTLRRAHFKDPTMLDAFELMPFHRTPESPEPAPELAPDELAEKVVDVLGRLGG